MNIILNNRPEILNQESCSITELLELKKFTFKMLVIKINGKVVKKDAYKNTFIHEGNDVMVLHLVSGG